MQVGVRAPVRVGVHDPDRLRYPRPRLLVAPIDLTTHPVNLTHAGQAKCYGQI
ncbi:hypothetical protein GCM10009743_05360 [Kribbella swartbergensis]